MHRQMKRVEEMLMIFAPRQGSTLKKNTQKMAHWIFEGGRPENPGPAAGGPPGLSIVSFSCRLKIRSLI